MNLRELVIHLKEMGWTRAMLANQLDVSPETISRWIRPSASVPSTAMTTRIALEYLIARPDLEEDLPPPHVLIGRLRKAGWTDTAIAKRLGRSRENITRWHNHQGRPRSGSRGVSLALAYLLTICHVCGRMKVAQSKLGEDANGKRYRDDNLPLQQV